MAKSSMGAPSPKLAQPGKNGALFVMAPAGAGSSSPATTTEPVELPSLQASVSEKFPASKSYCVSWKFAMIPSNG